MEIHNTHLYRKYNESVAIHSMFRYKKAMYSSMWTEKPNMGTRWDRFNRTQWRQLIVLTTNILKLKSVPSPVERGSPKSGASTEDCLSAQRTGRIDAHHSIVKKILTPVYCSSSQIVFVRACVHAPMCVCERERG